MADLENFAWPTPDIFDHKLLAAQCRDLDQYALIYGFADVWERPALVRCWENMFLDMVERPEWAHFLCRKFTDFYKEDYTRAAEASGGRIDFYLLISDLSGQQGPLVSKPMFREFIAPYLKDLIDCIHGLGAGALPQLRAVHSFIPDLIAMGVDVLDPIQPVGPLMTPRAVEGRFRRESLLPRRHRLAGRVAARHAG